MNPSQQRVIRRGGGERSQEHSLVPIAPCTSLCLSGATFSGKTKWVYRFLKHLHGMYVSDPPKKVLYCYGVYQDLFDEMERVIPNLTMHEGLPSSGVLETFADGQHGLIVLDDLMQQVLVRPDMELLFTQGCHHRHLSVIFITQNLYSQGKCARTIMLNTGYLILFKNVRDASQLNTLGRQLFPGRGGLLVDAYRDVMKTPYGYLVVDMTPQGRDDLRLRTHIFPGEEPLVYVPQL